MKLAIVSDTHFGVRNDNPVMYEWQRKFLNQVFFPTLEAHNIDTVLHAGDYGDRRKFVNYGTVKFIRDAYRDPLRRRGITEYALVGNHDCFLRDSTEVNTLNSLFHDDETLRDIAVPQELDFDGLGILMLPWIASNNRKATEDLIAKSSCSVVLGHLELAGFQMYRGMPAHDGMDASVFDRFELVMSGHYHHRSSQGPVTYLGAMWPMIWSDYRDPRGFHLFDTDTKTLEFVENPYSPFARLVYDDATATKGYIESLTQTIVAPGSPFYDAYVKIIVKSRNNPLWFDIMMDALAKVNPQDVVVVDDIIVGETTLDDDVSMDIDTMMLIRDYVENLQVSCDKPALQTYLRDLYHNAMQATQSVRLS